MAVQLQAPGQVQRPIVVFACHQNVGLPVQLLHGGHRLLGGEAHAQGERFGKQGLLPDLGIAKNGTADANVQPAFRQQAAQLVGRADRKVKGSARCLVAKRRHGLMHSARGVAQADVSHAEVQVPSHPVPGQLQFVAHPVQYIASRDGDLQRRTPERSERKA